MDVGTCKYKTTMFTCTCMLKRSKWLLAKLKQGIYVYQGDYCHLLQQFFHLHKESHKEIHTVKIVKVLQQVSSCILYSLYS